MLSAKEMLAGWLLEWELDQSDACPPAPLNNFEPEKLIPVVGMVRLLKPVDAFRAAYPRYVVIMKLLGCGNVLVAPFSRFSLPAVPDELLLEKSCPGCAVLSLWNLLTLSKEQLSLSWPSLSLGEEDLNRALNVVNNSADAGRYGGPEITVSFDPRLDYLDEERRSWSPLGKSCSQLLAAEDRPDYGEVPGDD